MTTRGDASVSSMAEAITNAANEIGAHAVSTGQPTSDLPSVSNVVSGMIAQNKATFNNGVLSIKMNTVNNCIILAVQSSNEDMNLTLAYGNAGADQICKALQQTIRSAEYHMPLKGSVIVR
jgi:hypothetical protein